jgi:hypothetical protein
MIKVLITVFLFTSLMQDLYARGSKRRSKRMTKKTRAVKNTQRPSRGRALASEDKGPIEVHGQTRNLNMLLTLQNEDDAINFIKLRKNYKKEILRQKY